MLEVKIRDSCLTAMQQISAINFKYYGKKKKTDKPKEM